MSEKMPMEIYVMPYAADTLGGFRDGTWSKNRKDYTFDQLTHIYHHDDKYRALEAEVERLQRVLGQADVYAKLLIKHHVMGTHAFNIGGNLQELVKQALEGKDA